MIRSNIDPNVFLSEVFQLHDQLSDLGEVVSNERLETVILDALPDERYSRTKVQSVRDPNIGLEEIMMMKTVFINHSERSSVPKISQESSRESRDWGRDPKMNSRESAMATIITCHNCKKPGHRKKDCKQLTKRTNTPSNVENGKRK